MSLSAPYPYFGGKGRVADVIWRQLGTPKTYIEPFGGSLAVLLNTPTPARCEVVNDLDGHITNVWRAIQADPEAVAHASAWPINELDMRARRAHLAAASEGLTRALEDDPHFYNARATGW